ncbi:MAG: hypothetical protein ACYC4M_04195 [Thermoleophilia bacterium]
MRKMFSFLAVAIRIALGVAAIAAIYNVLRQRRGCRRDGVHGS